MVDDERALEVWAQSVVVAHKGRALPSGGPLLRVVALPRWGLTIFARKAREIGFRNALRMSVEVASARLRGSR